MKIILSIIVCLIFAVSIFSQTNPNHIWVSGHYRSNGTYVEGYYKTASNHTNVDNFSTIGNKNPYTGESGWIKSDGQKNPWTDEEIKEAQLTYDIEPYKYTYISNSPHKSVKSTYESTINNGIWYSKGDQVNVRFEPNRDSKIAFRIDKGDEVKVLNKSGNQEYISGYGQDCWYEIKFKSLSGWVFGKLIGSYNYSTSNLNDWNGEYLTITKNSVNVRSDPTTKGGEVKFQLDKGNQVEILAKTTNKHFVNGYGEDYWYYIKFDDKVGWVFGRLTE